MTTTPAPIEPTKPCPDCRNHDGDVLGARCCRCPTCHGTGVEPTKHSAQSCNFFACHAGGDPCPFVANPKYRPEPTNTDAEPGERTPDELYENALGAAVEELGVDPKTRYRVITRTIEARQALVDTRVAEARKELYEMFIDWIEVNKDGNGAIRAVALNDMQQSCRYQIAQLAQPNHEEKK